jgi:hypothetical protein
MKRLVLAAALVLGLTLPALVSGAVPQPIYFWSDVAATISAPGQPPGAPELVRPSAIGLFADGSWDVDHLRWTGWGSSVAHANGISSKSNGIPNMAQGKRIKKPAQVTLSNPGRFQGHEVYRCFTLTVPAAAVNEKLCLKRIGSAWLLAPTTTTTTTNAKTASFYSPSHNLSCEIDDGYAGLVGAYCQSLNPPHSVHMGLDGRLKICSGGTITTTHCLGNAGLHTPTLAYGKQVTVGRFRCRSAQAGVTCVVIQSGKGFLINNAGVTPVGHAVVTPAGGQTNAPKKQAILFSPLAYGISCNMTDDGSFGGSWVYCWIGGAPQPTRHAKLNVDGRVSVTATTAVPLGLGGRSTPYGGQVTVGRFRCQSLRSGIKCTVVSTGKGFLFNINGATPVA